MLKLGDPPGRVEIGLRESDFQLGVFRLPVVVAICVGLERADAYRLVARNRKATASGDENQCCGDCGDDT